MKIYRTRDVKIPNRGTRESAGIDFYIPNDMVWETYTIQPGASMLIPSGIKVEVPKGYALIAMNKSGIAVKKNLQVGACVVDEDYQGEIHIHLTNIGSNKTTVSIGDKVVQFILLPVFYDKIEEVSIDELHKVKTIRSDGAFGSTGVK